MSLYTRKGDDGSTGLFDQTRVSKDDIRLWACGTVDELGAQLGLVASENPYPVLSYIIRTVQNELFIIGSQLADPRTEAPENMPRIGPAEINRLEEWIDQATAAVPPLKNFIVPGGSGVAARTHLARAVCRRAERCVVRLAREQTIADELIQYLNRLGDLLFAVARWANQLSNHAETIWKPAAPRS